MSKHRRRLVYAIGHHVHVSRRGRQLFIVLLTLLAAAAGSVFVTSALFHAGLSSFALRAPQRHAYADRQATPDARRRDLDALRLMVSGLTERVIAVAGETANLRAQRAPELAAVIAERQE